MQCCTSSSEHRLGGGGVVAIPYYLGKRAASVSNTFTTVRSGPGGGGWGSEGWLSGPDCTGRHGVEEAEHRGRALFTRSVSGFGLFLSIGGGRGCHTAFTSRLFLQVFAYKVQRESLPRAHVYG